MALTSIVNEDMDSLSDDSKTSSGVADIFGFLLFAPSEYLPKKTQLRLFQKAMEVDIQSNSAADDSRVVQIVRTYMARFLHMNSVSDVGEKVIFLLQSLCEAGSHLLGFSGAPASSSIARELLFYWKECRLPRHLPRPYEESFEVSLTLLF